MGFIYLILTFMLFSIKVQALQILTSLVGDGFGLLLNIPYYKCVFNEDLNLNVSLTRVRWYDVNVTYSYSIYEAAEKLYANTDFNKNSKILMLVTGFGAKYDNPAVVTVVGQLANTLPDTSVLMLDYYNYCKSSSTITIAVDYESAVAYSYYVAKALAEFLSRLKELLGRTFENFQIVGHSLGAQVGGMAGRIISNLIGEQVGKIVGLDPAGPCYNEAEIEHQLSWRNAARVEVYHSNMGQLGTVKSNGHVNYGPDGGRLRAACKSAINTIEAATCSHSQIVYDFIDSISNTAEFVARACDSWVDFMDCKCMNNSLAIAGAYSDANAFGNMFYVTNAVLPGRGVAGASPESCE